MIFPTCLRPPKHQTKVQTVTKLRAGGKPGTTFRDHALGAGSQRLLERQKVPPSETLLQWAAQQKGGMESCQRADFTATGLIGKPPSPRTRDAILDAEQGL